MDLTKRQKEIFDFIGKYAAKYGYSSMVREIGKAVGLHSSLRSTLTSRTWRRSGSCAATRPSCARSSCWSTRRRGDSSPGLPLVGEVAAGEPGLPRSESRSTSIPEVIGGETGDYILRVKGDSMKDAGILEGDYVIVWPTEVAGDGRSSSR